MNVANKKELSRFLLVGCSAVATDTLVYFILVQWMMPSVAKAMSFTSGSVVAYVFNKYWTFEQKHKSYSEVIRFSILYLSTLCVNVWVNKYVLNLSGSKEFAFLCATGTSTILNFIGQKFWVFIIKER